MCFSEKVLLLLVKFCCSLGGCGTVSKKKFWRRSDEKFRKWPGFQVLSTALQFAQRSGDRGGVCWWRFLFLNLSVYHVWRWKVEAQPICCRCLALSLNCRKSGDERIYSLRIYCFSREWFTVALDLQTWCMKSSVSGRRKILDAGSAVWAQFG